MHGIIMAFLPDVIYRKIQSNLHPSPASTWEPVTQATLGTSIQIFTLTEACYEVDPDFPFLQEDHSLLPLVDGRLSLMRFGLCLVRLPNSINVLLDAGLGPFLSDIQKCSGHPVPESPPHPLEDMLLKKFNSTLDDIDFVIHSHCHGDHVGWVGYFPKAIHVLHSKEYEYAQFVGCPWKEDAVARFEPLKDQGRLKFLEGEDNIVIDAEKCPELSVFLCPGHTPGHIGVKIQDTAVSENTSTTSTLSKPAVAYYIGDAMHFSCQVNYPDLVPLFDCCAWKSRPFLPTANVEDTWLPAMRQNPSWGSKTSSQARRRLLERIADESALLLSPHFSPPGMGTVEKSGDQFTYMPAATE